MEIVNQTTEADVAASAAVNALDWSVIESGEKSDIAHLIFGVAWDCFVAGWDKSKVANEVATQFLGNDFYRKGVVASFDGMEFTHGGSTWLRLKHPNGEITEFSLRNLADYQTLESFSMLKAKLSNDSYISALADQNAALAQSINLITSVIEKVYWRKVAASLQQHHFESKLKIKARSILLASGIDSDDVNKLIAQPRLDHD